MTSSTSPWSSLKRVQLWMCRAFFYLLSMAAPARNQLKSSKGSWLMESKSCWLGGKARALPMPHGSIYRRSSMLFPPSSSRAR
jgi:hypothetical protein